MYRLLALCVCLCVSVFLSVCQWWFIHTHDSETLFLWDYRKFSRIIMYILILSLTETCLQLIGIHIPSFAFLTNTSCLSTTLALSWQKWCAHQHPASNDTQDSFVREIYLAEAFVHVHLCVTWEEAIWSLIRNKTTTCVYDFLFSVSFMRLVCIPVLVWYIISVRLVQTTNRCLVWYNIYTSGTNYNKPMFV